MNLNIFYHQHAINDYQERFDNTYKKIVDSGLIKKIDKIYVNTDAAKIDNYYKVVSTYNERFTSESPTLMRLKEYAKSNSGCSLYLHSKGVTKPTSDKVQDWINMMEYFTIIKHSECLLNLEIGYNAVGVNYIDAVYNIKL